MKRLIFISIFILCTSCDGNNSSKKPTTIITTTEERQVEIKPPAEENTEEPETPVVVIADPEPEREPESPPVIVIADPEPLPPINEARYDYHLLLERGIHIEGRSILSELNYPAAIYCSNTKFLNSDKILELKSFELSLHGDYTQTMDNIEIQTTLLKKLVRKSISELESTAQSRFCPRIYLAIDLE